MNTTSQTEEFVNVNFYAEASTFQLKRFRFENHQLRIDSQKDLDEFEALIAGMAPEHAAKIWKISPTAADDVAQAHKKKTAHSGLLDSQALTAQTRVTQEISDVESLIRQGMDPGAAEAAVKQATMEAGEAASEAPDAVETPADLNLAQVETVPQTGKKWRGK